MAKLTGKVALVTGASKGIGAGIAKALAAEGAEQMVREIEQAGGKAIAVGGKVGEAKDVERIFAEVAKALGPVDVLVNNAGVYKWASLEEFTENDYLWQFDTNVKGLLLASQAAAKQFGERGGSIINIGSVVSTFTPANSVIYTATKGAVDAITGVLAKELGPKKIRVNAINPGLIVTEGVQTAGVVGSDFYNYIEKNTPLGRVGNPDDIAPVAVFLASEDAKWVTGELIQVAGGQRG